MRGGDGQIEKPKRRGYLHFEKVRVLFPPTEVRVSHEAAGYAVRYGPRPEHLIRHYPTLDKATAVGEKMAEKFGAKLVVENGSPVPHGEA